MLNNGLNERVVYMNETWKKSASMIGYEVSNRGNVRNEMRKKILSPTDNGGAYLIVGKKQGGKKKNYYVHRLVAEAFCSTKPGANEVNHKDCNKQNNNADNLEWCNACENMQHAIRNGRVVYTEGRLATLEKNRVLASNTHKKRVAVYGCNGEDVIYYDSQTEAGKALGVSIASISRAAKGHRLSCNGKAIAYA